MTLLERTVDVLVAREVAHALIGAAALAAHGVSRATLDQDLLVTDPRVLAPEFWVGLAGDAAVDIRTGDADDPLAGVVRIRMPGERDVDVVVGRHAWQDEVIQRAVPVGCGRLRVVEAADLIVLKLYAGGSQDRWDIEQLLALDSDAALVAHVDVRVITLPRSSRTMWAALRSTR